MNSFIAKRNHQNNQINYLKQLNDNLKVELKNCNDLYDERNMNI